MGKRVRLDRHLKAQWSLSAVIVAGLMVAGCGSSDSPSQANSDSDEATHIESDGRLAIAQASQSGVHVLNLDEKQMLATIPTDFVPSALYASPDKRYAVAIQRTENLVQFIDGGLFQEDHVDHLHDYAQAPALAGMRLTGIRPTHYEVAEGQAALFMDGDAESGSTAAVVTFSDESVEKGEPDASLPLPMQMHGTAEPRGAYLLTTWRAPANTDTLPELVELYKQEGNSFQFVQRFDIPCPRLHGSYSSEDYSVFGCQDGVLVIKQVGDDFIATKIDNLPSMPDGARVGTVLGHHESPVFVGLLANNAMVEIDPQAGTMTSIEWPSTGGRITAAFDHSAKNLLLLDDLGSLHALEVAAGWAVKSAIPVTAAIAEDDSRPVLDIHPSADRAFISDPNGKQIIIVDTASVSVLEQLPLDFVPSSVRWLGISEDHEHEGHTHD